MTDTSDPFSRFVHAQAQVHDAVCAELTAGRKHSHWMWFVFPQLQQLGRSSTARHFGLQGAAEALAYWQHPLLGPRLQHCTGLVLAVAAHRSALDIFGAPDDIKFRSCMTLFHVVAAAEPAFAAALQRFFNGQPDALTLQLLAA